MKGKKKVLGVEVKKSQHLEKCPAIAFWTREIDYSKAPCKVDILQIKYESQVLEVLGEH